MENRPHSIELVLYRLQKQAAASQTPLTVQARIVISPDNARLLAIQPERLLETITF